MEIKKLNKHLLSFDLPFDYLQENLSDANCLSSEVLKMINFKSGCFFTLLPSDSNLEEIYNFKCGGVLKQFSLKEAIEEDHRSTYCWVPNIEKELTELILNEIKRKNLNCFFDDVSASPIDKYYEETQDNISCFFNNEIYYFLDRNNMNKELVFDCLNYSFSFWHSLCLLTKIEPTNIQKKLSQEILKKIIFETDLMIVGAYDGEGYLFWEKKGMDFGKENIDQIMTTSWNENIYLQNNIKTKRSSEGAWVKDHKLSTQEILHPHFEIAKSQKPHWDYFGPEGKARLFIQSEDS